MRQGVCRFGCAVVLLVVSTGGCAPGPAGGPPPAQQTPEGSREAESEVRERFTEIQAAIKARQTDKLWDLMSSRSRADAEKVAKFIRTACSQASPEEKAKQQKDLGLAEKDLLKLTGKELLGTKRFLRKYDEVAGGTVDRVTAYGDHATVYFTETDGDKEKMVFLREEGQWKAWLSILSIPWAKKP
jgi:hypothetical protein